ncbi:MAG: hypothetical protein U0469_00030 [Candidatus Paceibacterota bacterium]|jgi:Fe-S oxidoreductase
MNFGKISNFERNNKDNIDNITSFFEDYANDFIGVDTVFLHFGIEKVREIFIDGYKVSTASEYLEKSIENKKKVVSLQEQKNPIFIKKSEILNNLAEKINSLGKNIEEDTFKSIISEVKKVVYGKY